MSPARPSGLSMTVYIALALVIASFIAYWPLRNCDFVNFDDTDYVTNNRHVSSGVTWDNLRWAFTARHAGNWHPLTWVSHMADCQVYGLRPGGHHLTNLLLHAATAVLLFLLLTSMTGARWRSAAVAALFALHPLHVESVAWIAERKDLLCALFMLLALRAYVAYVKAGRRAAYAGALVLFGLSLLSKPMAVTLPALLLLLDFWPLGRFEGSWRATTRLVIEKIPFVTMAAASAAMTLWAQSGAGAVIAVEKLALGSRAANALVSAFAYIERMIWPVRLAVFYPYRQQIALLIVIGAAVILIGITALSLWQARKRPWVITGWLWYLIMLLPVIGLVQVGTQSMADRYTYLPLTGLFVIAVWGGAELAARRRSGRIIGIGLTGGVLLALTIATWRQVNCWHSSVTLFEHALQVTRYSNVAHSNLGCALAQRGDYRGAVVHFREALRLSRGDDADVYVNLGGALMEQGETDSAAGYAERALAIDKSSFGAWRNLGLCYAKRNLAADAERCYRQSLTLKPDYWQTHMDLGLLLRSGGRTPEAAAQFSEVIGLMPGSLKARFNRGDAFFAIGNFAGALADYLVVARAAPGLADAQEKTGRCWSRLGKPDSAIVHLKRAVELAPDSVSFGEELRRVSQGSVSAQ